jgi:N-glycosylase/DNA lyase
MYHYLDLKRDLAFILDTVNVDAYIDRAIDKFRGMRLLNQEIWETIASFILSQNNNMVRIRKIIRTLSERFGQKVEYDGYVDYTFPTPNTLANAGIDKIFECGTGYRASYLWNAANNVLNDILVLDTLKQLDYVDAKHELMKLQGVGEKVADCICLFSLGHLGALPIDVWIKRIFERVYLCKTAKTTEIQDFAKHYFGEYVGYAQQYLFHYAQNQPNWDDAEHLALRNKKR